MDFLLSWQLKTSGHQLDALGSTLWYHFDRFHCVSKLEKKKKKEIAKPTNNSDTGEFGLGQREFHNVLAQGRN